MKNVKVGDTCKAVCQDCKAVVDITFQLRDVPFSNGMGIVEQVLSGVCNQCDRVISIPHQSTPEIKKAYDKYTAEGGSSEQKTKA